MTFKFPFDKTSVNSPLEKGLWDQERWKPKDWNDLGRQPFSSSPEPSPSITLMGWECPRCHTIHNPSTSVCYCRYFKNDSSSNTDDENNF